MILKNLDSLLIPSLLTDSEVSLGLIARLITYVSRNALDSQLWVNLYHVFFSVYRICNRMFYRWRTWWSRCSSPVCLELQGIKQHYDLVQRKCCSSMPIIENSFSLCVVRRGSCSTLTTWTVNSKTDLIYTWLHVQDPCGSNIKGENWSPCILFLLYLSMFVREAALCLFKIISNTLIHLNLNRCYIMTLIVTRWLVDCFFVFGFPSCCFPIGWGIERHIWYRNPRPPPLTTGQLTQSAHSRFSSWQTTI